MPHTVRNASTIFAEIPTGLPVVGKTLKKVEGEIDLDAPLDAGSILVKTKALSYDPYQRGRMRDASRESYVPAFALGEPITNFGVGEVLKSENDKFKVGQHVYGHLPFSEYSVLPKAHVDTLRYLENKENLPWTTWVGAAGMPGQTAWWGLREIGRVQKGETVFVSGATGPVGQMTIALAHRVGAKVIASAGSDEKVAFLRDELKVEVAFNYKTDDTREILAKYKKESGGFQVYVDNVAGPTLEAALEFISARGRVVSIGAINDYNGSPHGIKNIFYVIGKELKMEGFIILNRLREHPELEEEFYATIPKLIADGSIAKPKEHIFKGLDNGEAFSSLFDGSNFGKAVISLE